MVPAYLKQKLGWGQQKAGEVNGNNQKKTIISRSSVKYQ